MTRLEMIHILEQGNKIIKDNEQMECPACHKEYRRNRKAFIQKCPDCGAWLIMGKEAVEKLKKINYAKADRKRWRGCLKGDLKYLKRNKEPFKYLLESVGLRFNKKDELVNCK